VRGDPQLAGAVTVLMRSFDELQKHLQSEVILQVLKVSELSFALTVMALKIRL